MAVQKLANGNLVSGDLLAKGYTGDVPFTISGWFLLTNYSDWGAMFHVSTNGSDANQADFEIYSVNATGVIAAGAFGTLTSGIVAGPGVFRHVTFTYNGLGGTASKRLYVDGTSTATGNGSISATWRYFASSRSSHGQNNSVAENVQVYRRLLSAEEVSVIGRRKVPLAGCVAWYPMLAGGGYSAGRDFSGEGNHMSSGGAGVADYTASAPVPWGGRVSPVSVREDQGLTGTGKLQRAAALEAGVGKTPAYAFPSASGASSVWLALERGDCGDSGQYPTEVEFTGSGYARANVPAANWAAAVIGENDAPVSISTSASVSFGPSAGALANWGTITHLSKWKHPTSRDPQYFCGRAALDPPRQVTLANRVLLFAAGEITFSDTTGAA